MPVLAVFSYGSCGLTMRVDVRRTRPEFGGGGLLLRQMQPQVMHSLGVFAFLAPVLGGVCISPQPCTLTGRLLSVAKPAVGLGAIGAELGGRAAAGTIASHDDNRG